MSMQVSCICVHTYLGRWHIGICDVSLSPVEKGIFNTRVEQRKILILSVKWSHTNRVRFRSLFNKTDLHVLSQLSKTEREELHKDITKLEVIKASNSLSSNKAPGKMVSQQTSIIPLMTFWQSDLCVYHEGKQYKALPQHMNASIIPLRLKPKKNPLECGSHIPIQILNVHYVSCLKESLHIKRPLRAKQFLWSYLAVMVLHW